MINIPVVPPDLLNALEVDFGTTIAASIWKRIKEQEHWINACIPPGIIMFFYQSQTYAGGGNIDAPNSSWQFCDGSLITNTDSPFLGLNVPDLRNQFLKHGNSEAIGVTHGLSAYNLKHDHGGFTDYAYDVIHDYPLTLYYTTEDGTDWAAGNNHAHAITEDLDITIEAIPNYIELQPYMRIV